MSDATAAARPVSSADILIRLERSQRGFRAVMMVLGVMLLLVAVIVAASTAFSIAELSELQRKTEEIDATTAEIEQRAGAARARQVVAHAETLRRLENSQTSWREFAADYNSAQRNFEIVDSLADRRPEEVLALAVDLASDHLTGTPLDLSTQAVLWRALNEKDRAGQLVAQGDERTLLEAARADWMRIEEDPLDERVERNPDRARILFDTLVRTGQSERMRGLGHAGMAERWAADTPNAVWLEGCKEAVDHAEAALRLGVEGPNIHQIMGQCLRKNGDTAEAYQAFVKEQALVAANEETYGAVWRPYTFQALHGMGTTLLALAAQLAEDEPLRVGEGAALTREQALEQARQLLEQAADARLAFGSSDVGANGSRENIGIIHLLRGDWDAALAHTEEIDAVIAMPWNLTFRYIAAQEKLAALAGAGTGSAEADEAANAAGEAWLVLGEFAPSRFAPRELEALLPQPLHHYVTEVVAHAENGEGAQLAAN